MQAYPPCCLLLLSMHTTNVAQTMKTTPVFATSVSSVNPVVLKALIVLIPAVSGAMVCTSEQKPFDHVGCGRG